MSILNSNLLIEMIVVGCRCYLPTDVIFKHNKLIINIVSLGVRNIIMHIHKMNDSKG